MLPATVSDGRRLSKPAMKLLVLAQTPPPLHGQSRMAQVLVTGLPALGIPLHHVPLNLSRDSSDIGRWRPGKVLALLRACVAAWRARRAAGCDTLYYIPAPARRGALYRDWVVMLLCRPFFPRLVLHWHASGLGAWLGTRATPPERWLTSWLLGRADVAIVLTDSLRADAAVLHPRRVAVVSNGIPDPCPAWTPRPANPPPHTVLFLGLCAAEKGLFDAAAAVLAANRAAGTHRFSLVAAGPFADAATAARFTALAAEHPQVVRHAGFVTGPAKDDLLRASFCLCLPTRYPHEAQPLVLLEALAHDLPVIATDWRGISATLPPGPLCAPGDVPALAAALLALDRQPPAPGDRRAHFLRHFTVERHLARLAAALSGTAAGLDAEGERGTQRDDGSAARPA